MNGNIMKYINKKNIKNIAMGCFLMANAQLMGAYTPSDATLAGTENSDRQVIKAPPLCVAIMEKNKDQLLHLLKKGSPVDKIDANGYTPLHYALIDAPVEFVSILLEHGANPNTADAESQWTPLHWAAHKANREAVKLLLEQPGIEVNAKDNYGLTPLQLAEEDLRDILRSRDLKFYAATFGTPFSEEEIDTIYALLDIQDLLKKAQAH
ncbi:MAG: ankyrin repeat domain-containing protein [Puniceicoccales bacterium]|jgi:ankyrin repeat protein|nr:ankyrin repeat domain-containing protein [Puniceicoccales bacterium]